MGGIMYYVTIKKVGQGYVTGLGRPDGSILWNDDVIFDTWELTQLSLEMLVIGLGELNEIYQSLGPSP